MKHVLIETEWPATLPLETLMHVLPFRIEAAGTTEWLATNWSYHWMEHDQAWIWIAHSADGWCIFEMWMFEDPVAAHLRIRLRFDGSAILEKRLADFEQTISHSIQTAKVQAADQNSKHYPLTRQAFQAMGAETELARIEALDARWAEFEYGTPPALRHSIVPALPPASQTFDLVYAGGGLGLLHAALMAQKGYRVLVFDRYEVGCTHREWNISHEELERLVATGLITWDELEAHVIMKRYTNGVVRFYAAGTTVEAAEIHLPEVLNLALDAGALLRHMRNRFETVGGIVAEGYQFEHVFASNTSSDVVVQVTTPSGNQHIQARLFIDAMGATSPLALATQPFSGICPTVGTVIQGVQDHDPYLGDILISVADTQRGRQLIWEGFPGRADELTVYVFYYDQVGQRAQHTHSLLDLFEDYFQLLDSYKKPGPDFVHLRPVYGYIPGRHSLSRPMPLRGVLPIGDASAQQSPLTFCGFGSFIRNLQRTVDGVEYALEQQLLKPKHLQRISAYQANVSMNWVFSRFMTPWQHPHDVNELQNVFARVMNQLGADVAQRFFQDQMTWTDYRRVILGTLDIYPHIMATAWQVLGPRDIFYWIRDWVRFSGSALMATMFGPVVPKLLTWQDQLPAGLRFRIVTTVAEWRAMGWLH